MAFFIVPLFAFANAGVTVEAGTTGLLKDSVMLGVGLGLFVGKPLGVLGFTWLAVKARMGHLPEGVGWTQVAGAAALCGVGFTMALFIGGLAFQNPTFIAYGKVGILLGSSLSAILGMVLLRMGRRARASR